MSSMILCTQAYANVQGMSSSQLAAFAQSQTTGVSSFHQPQTQPRPSENQYGQIAQDNVEQFLSTLQGSYGAASVQGQTSYSVKNYNRSVPKLRKEVKIEKFTESNETVQSNRVVSESKSTNVQVVGEPSDPESQETGSWMTAVTKYDSKLSAEESRLIAAKPVIQEQVAQGYAKQSFSGVSVQKASFSHQPNTYKAGRSSITPAPNSRAPTIGNSDFYAFKPASLECVIDAANAYEVPAYVLLGIASQERGKNGQRVKNTNGSFDLGHFQLNTIHFRSDGYFKNIDVNDAKWRGCYNAELAAWLLRKHLLRTDRTLDFWTRVAGYHSWTPSKNAIYRNSVRKYAQDWQSWLSKRNSSAL